MPKKYEKFEEWMVGKTVLWDGEKGVVTREYEGEGNCVWVEWESPLDGEGWIEVESLTFLDIPCSDAQSQSNGIPWEVGQVVWDVVYGKGVIGRVDTEATRCIGAMPVIVVFDSGEQRDYSYEGVSNFPVAPAFIGTRTLFFSEPTIIADTMPPKKPSVPKLKFDDGLMVINSQGKVECYGYVEQEFEDSVAMRTGEVYEKAYYNFFKLGEEIKWEN